MAGEWIKVELELPDKPEVHYIANALNLDPDAVVGKLIRVWAWFDRNTEDGNAYGVTYLLLDRITRVTGFGEVMALSGWIEQRDKVLFMPKFERHNAQSSKKRVEKFRNAFVTQSSLLREEEEKKKITPKNKEVASLPDWVPLEAWQGFCEMRKKSKTAFTERAKTLLIGQLHMLKESGEDIAKVLDQSTANGWKGVFVLKGGNGKTQSAPWWSSNEGIQAKAVELHIESRKGESWNDLKARVNAAMDAQ